MATPVSNNRKAQREAFSDRNTRSRPKCNGIYSFVNDSFSRGVAERGKQILEEKDDGKSTYAPKPGEPKEVHLKNLIEATKNNVESDDDLPTFGPGSKRRSTPAEISCEEGVLDPLSKTSKETNGFAPPKIPDIDEISKFKEEGTTHSIITKYTKPKRNQLRPVRRDLLTGENEYEERE